MRSPVGGAIASPRYALRSAFGAASFCMILAGVLLMRRVAPPFAQLPTGIFGEVFPDNAIWVIAGTLCAVLGCAGAALWLPTSLSLPVHCLPARTDVPPDGGAWRIADPALQAPEAVQRRAVWPGVAGTVLYAGTLLRAHGHASGAPDALCLIASLLLLGVALSRIVPSVRTGTVQPPVALTLRDGAVVVALMVAFIALNASDLRLWVYAYIGDEWPFYDAARAIALGGPYDVFSQTGVYGIHPVLDSAYQALSMHLIGLNVVGWRMSCILAAALPIAPLYWLARQIGGAAFAAAGSTLYAACALLWAFSHIGYNSNDPLLTMVPAVALIYAGVVRDRRVLLFAAGACAGAGWYTLYTGRLTIAVLMLFLLTEWGGGTRAAATRLAVVVAGFALAAAPLFVDNGIDTIRQMLPLVSLSHARTVDPAPDLLVQNSVRGAYAFLHATQHTHYVVGALFDPLSAAALCAGTVLALRRARSRESRLLLIWLAITVGLTTPLYYAQQIADTRMQVAVPPAALLAAWGLCAVCQAVAQPVAGRARGVVCSAGVAAGLVTVVALNWLHFFRGATALPQRWPAYPVVLMSLEAITTYPAGSTFILPADIGRQNPTGDLCLVLEGFGVDLGTILVPAGDRVVTYCSGTRGRIAPPFAVYALVDAPAAASGCLSPPRTIYRENQGTLWIFEIGRPAGAAIAPRSLHDWLMHRCPALESL